MKNSISKKLSLVFASAVLGLTISFSAMAATPTGTLEGADHTSVYGWVWDSDSYGHVIPVEISVFPAHSSEVLKTATVKADHYQEKLQESIGDGYHGFQYSVDWSQFDRDELRVAAYAVTETERVFLGELTYNKVSDHSTPVSGVDSGSAISQADTSSPQNLSEPSAFAQAPVSSRNTNGVSVSMQAPAPLQALSETAVSDKALEQVSASVQTTDFEAHTISESSDRTSDEALLPWQKGPGFVSKKKAEPEKVLVSLGTFTVTGYCSCEVCCPSSVSKLTYSGTKPQPGHTVSADVNIFPIGTRLMIDGIVYTVEDIGSNVTANKIDIFYATHEEALAHGTVIKEVFAVTE